MKKRLYIYLIVALFAISACDFNSVEHSELPNYSEQAIDGELFVKFSPEVDDILQSIKSTEEGPATRSGILSVDEILNIIGAYQLERVFPYNAQREEVTRKSELHLWYLVRFDKSHKPEDVAKKLSQLGEVSMVDYNRGLKRASTAKAIPLPVEALNRAKSAQAYASNFNDPLLKDQWNLINNAPFEGKSVVGADVQIEEAWKLNTGDPSIIVAVLDEGIDVNHPDLKDNMWQNEGEIYRSTEDNDNNGYIGDRHGYNFVADCGVISADNVYDTGHGTHVAGVIAAVNNNGIGISSIAGGNGNQSGVKIMSCQIFSGNLAGTVLAEVQAIKYAADNGAVILQCSWGYISGSANPFDWVPQYSTDEEWKSSNPIEVAALDYFVNNAGSPNGVINGGIAIFASGNESAPSASYPAAYPEFVSVAATAADYTPATYTNYGPGTTISAPGGDQDYYYEYGEGFSRGAVGCILSTVPTNVSESGYAFFEGTSMACPHVSGIVALALSYANQLRKQFTPDEIKSILYETATPIDSYFEGTKLTYKFVTDLGDNTALQMKLDDFKGKMGAGQINATAMLQAIENGGVEMKFPNIYLGVGEQKVAYPSAFFVDGDNYSYTVEVENTTVATASVEGNKLIFNGLQVGSTQAKVVSSGNKSMDFVITVRDNASDNGWL